MPKVIKWMMTLLLVSAVSAFSQEKMRAPLPESFRKELPPEHWVYQYFQRLNELEIFGKTSKYSCRQLLTRFEVAVGTARALDRVKSIYGAKETKPKESKEHTRHDSAPGPPTTIETIRRRELRDILLPLLYAFREELQYGKLDVDDWERYVKSL